MANVNVKDYSGNSKYLKSTGAGSDADPYIPEHLDTNSAAILTAVQAIQTAVQILDNIVAGSEAQVDVVTSALPSGASTAAAQATAQTALDAIQAAVELLDNAISGTEMQVDVVSSALPADAATQTTLAAVLAKLTADPATQTTLAALLTELQAKADLAETQPVSAASLPLPSGAASSARQDIGNGTLLDIKTAVQLIDNMISGSEAQVDVVGALPAGTNAIGAVKDNGPQTAGTHTYTTSADMSSAADIGPAPTAGQKSVLLQAVISVGTAMEFTLQMETTPGAERVSFLLPANGSIVFIPRHPIKVGTADKKWQGKASAAGQVRISTTVMSEA